MFYTGNNGLRDIERRPIVVRRSNGRVDNPMFVHLRRNRCPLGGACLILHWIVNEPLVRPVIVPDIL